MDLLWALPAMTRGAYRSPGGWVTLRCAGFVIGSYEQGEGTLAGAVPRRRLLPRGRRSMEEVLSRYWWAFIVRGILAIALGVMVTAWPAITLAAFIFVFGIY